MDENEEEKEYNDIESLAAYLHSGKMQALKAAEKREELGLPPELPETEGGNELEGVLFTLEGKKRPSSQQKNVISASDYDSVIRRSNQQEPVHYEKKRSAVAAPEPPAKITPAQHPQVIVQDLGEDVQKTAPVPKKVPAKKKDQVSAETSSDVKHENGSFADNAKKMLGGLFSDGKHGKEAPKKKESHIKAENSSDDNPAEVPALAASLSEALGEKAAELVEQNRNSLPPEDIPEIYDVEDGTDEAENFDKTATRLMNAVNDPQARSVSMKDDVEAEEEEMRAERMQAARLRRSYERQKQSTRTLAYILIALLLCTAILGAAAYASTYLVKWALDFTGVASTEFKIDVTIPDDADIEMVAAILSENNIISDAKFFKLYADFADRIKKNDAEFIGGKYTVSSTMSYSTLLSILRTKVTEQKTVDVRITEGMTAREIGELLEANNVCFADDFEKYYRNIQNNYDFERRVKENSLKFNQLEGYLFPDTYQFYVVNAMETGGAPDKNETAEEAYEKMKKASEENALEAAKKMYSNFNSKLTRSMYKRMGEMHFTLDDTMALASLVQKEAASEEDMGKVASVFLNRIRNSAEYPYLQSDVTVLYVENDIKPYITGTDSAKQRIYNAYNTYTCKGIPAGAVCNPGLAAINAVLYAPETPYLYFCANEETGEIYYASTIEEHEQNLIAAGIVGSLEEAEALEESLYE